MIAAFLAAEGDHPGRWEREDRPEEPDPVALWLLRVFSVAIVAFWAVTLWHAWRLLP
jgi:hypothetical protein